MFKKLSNKIICGIYKIVSPNGKIYIGQSIDIYKREALYRLAHCKMQTYLYHSIKKYGWETHKFEVIHRCLPEELNKLEKYYVDLFNTFNSKNGLNVKDGGGKSGRMAEETKRKIGLKSKGRKFSEDVKKRIGHLSSLKKLSKSHKEKFTFSGRKHSEEWKRKASIRNSGTNSYFYGKRKFGDKNPMYGKKRKEESLNLMRKLILNTETGIFYNGTNEAAFSIGMKWNMLRDRLNGVTKNNTPLIRV